MNLAAPHDVDRLRELYADTRLDPPLGWEAVTAYERAHGVVLPEPYRTFVAEVSRGGERCGPPRYGLWPPGVDNGWTWFAKGDVSRPFPLTEPVEWPDDHDAAGFDGLLPLGTDGCGMYWALVVTGDQRGAIWYFDEYQACPAGHDAGEADDLVRWVARWRRDNPSWVPGVDMMAALRRSTTS